MAIGRLGIALVVIGLAAGPAVGDVDVATVPYKPGDLVFITGRGEEAAAIAALTGSPLTEVGVIRETGGGPYVLFACADWGTDELPLEEFIARGAGEAYALYRPNDPRAIGPGLNPATIRIAYDRYYLAPYDPFYGPGRDALYGAELLHVLFAEAGSSLGVPHPLVTGNAEAPEVRRYFMADWSARPECAELDARMCWQLVRRTEIVTPADLAADPHLDLVKSTFPAESVH